MKTIICIFLLTIFHQYDCKVTVSDMQKSEIMCMKELQFKPSDVPDISNFHQDSVDNPKTRQMLACIFVKMGILDEEQKISPDGFDNFVEALTSYFQTDEQLIKLIRESLKQCKDIEGRTGGEIGLQLKSCIRRAALEVRQKYQKN